MKKRFYLLLLPLIAGLFAFSKPKSAIVETKAAAADRLLYFERARVNGLPEWWIDDDKTFLHYWTSGTGDVLIKTDKIGDDLFTATIPGFVLDSGGGFRFAVHNLVNTHNQTQWNNATTYRDNGHNYFLLTAWNGEWNELSTESSIYGATYEITKYRGATVIGADEVPADENYTPSFIYQQGYKLEGWYTNAALTTPYVVGKLSGNISLYGKYTAVSDYYVYFRKPDTWGSSINAYYYYEGAGIPLGCQCANWPGDPMTDVMGGGHGYVIKVDASYNPNIIVFNDGTNQTGNTPLVAEKVYTYEGEGAATAHDFEYRLFKSWAPWDDAAKDFAENYVVGNGVTVAIKVGDTVKMNVSGHIWAPFAKLTGTNLATYFEEDTNDGNYKAKVSGVYKFTFDRSLALGAATGTKTAQISADNSTVLFELVTVENDKIAAVDQRVADINTCEQYEDYGDYVAFVNGVLGPNGMTLISSENQAKLALMSRYIVTPPQGEVGIDSNQLTNTPLNATLLIGLLGITTLAGYYFLTRKKKVA